MTDDAVFVQDCVLTDLDLGSETIAERITRVDEFRRLYAQELTNLMSRTPPSSHLRLGSLIVCEPKFELSEDGSHIVAVASNPGFGPLDELQAEATAVEEPPTIAEPFPFRPQIAPMTADMGAARFMARIEDEE